MGVTLQQKNPNAIKDRIKAMGRVTVKVGVQGTEATRDHGGITTVDLAAIHEFGLGNVPRRSWLGGWYDENEELAKDKLRKGFQNVIAGKINTATLGMALGVWAVASIQERFGTGIGPPLADATRDRKDSSLQLVDHGVFKGSITFIVETGETVSGVIP